MSSALLSELCIGNLTMYPFNESLLLGSNGNQHQISQAMHFISGKKNPKPKPPQETSLFLHLRPIHKYNPYDTEFNTLAYLNATPV